MEQMAVKLQNQISFYKNEIEKEKQANYDRLDKLKESNFAMLLLELDDAPFEVNKLFEVLYSIRIDYGREKILFSSFLPHSSVNVLQLDKECQKRVKDKLISKIESMSFPQEAYQFMFKSGCRSYRERLSSLFTDSSGDQVDHYTTKCEEDLLSSMYITLFTYVVEIIFDPNRDELMLSFISLIQAIYTYPHSVLSERLTSIFNFPSEYFLKSISKDNAEVFSKLKISTKQWYDTAGKTVWDIHSYIERNLKHTSSLLSGNLVQIYGYHRYLFDQDVIDQHEQIFCNLFEKDFESISSKKYDNYEEALKMYDRLYDLYRHLFEN